MLEITPWTDAFILPIWARQSRLRLMYRPRYRNVWYGGCGAIIEAPSTERSLRLASNLSKLAVVVYTVFLTFIFQR
jgi:hypothetical protein